MGMKQALIKILPIACIISFIDAARILPVLYKMEYMPCVLDGMVLFGTIRTSGLVSFFITFFNIDSFKYDFKAYNIVQRKRKMDVWYNQMLYIFVQCFIVVAVLMVCTGVVFYDYTGSITNFNRDGSMFMAEFAAAGLEPPQNVSLFSVIMMTALLNSGEIYVRVMIALLVYWVTSSSVIMMVSSIAAGMFLPQRNISAKRMYNVDWYPVYTELYDTKRLIISIAYIVVCVLVIWLLAKYFIPKKEFLRE